jgi:hypothetical protein
VGRNIEGLFHRFASGDVLPEATAARAGIRNVRALALDVDGRLWVGMTGDCWCWDLERRGYPGSRHRGRCARAAPAPPANANFDFHREAKTRAR